MASPSEQEVQELREKVNELRRQVAEADGNKAARIAEQTRKDEVRQLEAEQTRLQAKLNKTRTRAEQAEKAPSVVPAPNTPPPSPAAGADNKEG